jgi:hypothetical protein
VSVNRESGILVNVILVSVFMFSVILVSGEGHCDE